MFGIGFSEIVIILVVLLIAVGPEKMPTFMKAVGRGMREFRRATRELRSSVGIDELLRDEDLRDLRRPIDLNRAPKKPEPRRPDYDLTDEDAQLEFPSEGTDVAFMKAHPPTKEGAPESEEPPSAGPREPAAAEDDPDPEPADEKQEQPA